jgi:phosphoribosyl 1,2-cyclic phosphodiesterase
MKVLSLQSGSNGNCIYVASGDSSVLVDAGISGVRASDRLASFHIDIRSVTAVVITHDHADHIAFCGVYRRKFGLPVYMSDRTYEAAKIRHKLGRIKGVEKFHSGESIRIGGLTLHTVPTPHDATDGVAIVVEDGRHRVGVLTDLGHVFPGLDGIVSSLDAVLLESNYDPEMLAKGPYPEMLRQRIRGPGGHLSNEEAAELLLKSGRRLSWACLAHLSAENNTPELALETHRRILPGSLPLLTASRYAPVEMLEL